MVEANEEKKVDMQLQDKQKTNADETVSGILDLLDRSLSVGLINERVNALKKLKQEVSVHSLIFAKFEAEHQPKMKSVPVFSKGVKFYNKINA